MADNGAENVIPLKRKAKRVRTDWASEWQTSENGQPLTNLFNTHLTLCQHPELKDILRFDELALEPTLVKQIPNAPKGTIPRHVSDTDVLLIQEEIQRAGLRRVARDTVSDAVSVRALEMSFHPVREVLRATAWDGRERLSTMLSYYFGCEPPEDATEADKRSHGQYIKAIGRMFLIGLVARVMKPGCKSDYMLVLEGPQGILKSTALRTLVGDQWFGDDMPQLGPHADAVRVSMYLRGKWLIEIGELHAFSKSDARQLKQFVTRQSEKFIAKYGRRQTTELRQCLFVGTTNEDTYLTDPTGGRRYWPVKTGTIDIPALIADREQLFAEAVAAFDAGEPWWPQRDFEAKTIAPVQADRQQSDVWQEAIEHWIADKMITRCTAGQVLRDALQLTAAQTKMAELRRVTDILRRLQWVHKRSNGKEFYWPPKV